MGVALCHRIPRVPVVYVVLLLLMISIVLELVVVGLRNKVDVGGEFTRSGVKVGRVGGYPHVSLMCAQGLNCGGVVCDSNFEIVSMDCSRFLESFHNVNAFVVTSLVLACCTVVFIMLIAKGMSRNLVQLRFMLVVSLCFPNAFMCAAAGSFFVDVVPNARRVVSAASSSSVGSLSFSRGAAANIYIAALSVSCSSLLVMLIYFGVQCVRRDDPESGIEDWMQQREVLRNHAKAVHAEIKFKSEVDPTLL